MVQKSQGQPPGMHKNPVKNGDVYHINWLAGFLPSTVLPALGMLALEINMTSYNGQLFHHNTARPAKSWVSQYQVALKTCRIWAYLFLRTPQQKQQNPMRKVCQILIFCALKNVRVLRSYSQHRSGYFRVPEAYLEKNSPIRQTNSSPKSQIQMWRLSQQLRCKEFHRYLI